MKHGKITVDIALDVEPLVFLRDALDELWRARFKHPNEEGELTDAEWLAVLTEEVGEAARAIQDETDERLRAELVQVAAMAMRWAVSIPHGRVRPPWAQRNNPATGLSRCRSACPGYDGTCAKRACSECGRDLHGYRGPRCRYCDGTAE